MPSSSQYKHALCADARANKKHGPHVYTEKQRAVKSGKSRTVTYYCAGSK